MNISWLVWLAVLVGAIVAWTLGLTLAGVNLHGVTVDRVATVFTSLIFVALLIERAVEVFISPSTGAAKEALVTQQTKVQKTIADLKSRLEAAAAARLAAVPMPLEKSAAELALEEALAGQQVIDTDLARRIAAEDRKTQRLALAFSVPISIVVALAGVRAIDGFLPAVWVDSAGAVVAETAAGAVRRTTLSAMQQQLFTLVDVVLTAGLLAGGADGVHKILDRFIKLASGKEQPKAPETTP